MTRRPAHGRPRPVADPVVGELAARADEVARRWLLVRLEAATLEEAAAVPVSEFARAAPGVCAAVLDAVGSDDALDRLAADAIPGEAPADALAALAGSREGPAVVAAAEALRRAVSQAAADELPRGDAEVLAALTDRLAHVCARLAAATMAGRGADAARLHDTRPTPAANEDPSEPAASGPAASGPHLAPAPSPDGGTAPLWRAALERQLADGGRFGLLLVELDGADRLVLTEGDSAARDLFARTGRAVRGAVRRIDLLAHEEDGRMWVVAPDAGRPGAEALAVRVADAVERAATVRGAPLTASVGIALYPDDGRDAEALTSQAEESALAARAAGVRVAGGPGA